jgi:hypothetical protein
MYVKCITKSVKFGGLLYGTVMLCVHLSSVMISSVQNAQDFSIFIAYCYISYLYVPIIGIYLFSGLFIYLS